VVRCSTATVCGDRLFTTLVIPPVRDTAHRLHWSLWLRRHQVTARRTRYRRRRGAELAL
jgi:hypothetical protein